MRRPMVLAMQRLDVDGDAVVTKAGSIEPYSRMAQQLDSDDDGEVSLYHPRDRTPGQARYGHRDRRGSVD